MVNIITIFSILRNFMVLFFAIQYPTSLPKIGLLGIQIKGNLGFSPRTPTTAMQVGVGGITKTHKKRMEVKNYKDIG